MTDRFPWNMWGSSQVLTVVPNVGPLGNNVQRAQLASIQSARPQTWCFFFAVTLISGGASQAASTVELFVDFDLSIGIGRSLFTQPQSSLVSSPPGFCRVAIETPPLVTPVSGQQFWASSVPLPILDSSPPVAQQFRAQTDRFVSQDVQCGVRVMAAGLADAPYLVEAHAYFAPQAWPAQEY